MPDACAEIPEDYTVVNAQQGTYPQKEPLSVGTTAPEWTLPTVQKNDTLSLEVLRGKVVLLSFWYKSFGPCLHYLQALQKLHKKFQKRGLVVVGINSCDRGEELAEFLQQRGITYLNLIDDVNLEDSYQARTPNTFYLLDQTGKVRYATIAQEDFPQKGISKKIKQLLKQL